MSDLPMAAASKGHEDRVDEEEEAIDVGNKEVDGIWAPEKSFVAQSDFEAGTMSEEQAKYREEYLEEKASRKREFSESEVSMSSSTLALIVRLTKIVVVYLHLMNPHICNKTNAPPVC